LSNIKSDRDVQSLFKRSKRELGNKKKAIQPSPITAGKSGRYLRKRQGKTLARSSFSRRESPFGLLGGGDKLLVKSIPKKEEQILGLKKRITAHFKGCPERGIAISSAGRKS